MIFSKKIVKTWRFTEFLHGGSCGNQISAWGVMQKSDSFSVVLWRFHEFFYRYRNLSMTIAYIDSYRNNHFWVNFWHTKWTLKTQSSYIEIAQFTKRTAVSLKHINFIDKFKPILYLRVRKSTTHLTIVIMHCWQMMANKFYTYKTDYWCSRPRWFSVTRFDYNGALKQLLKSHITCYNSTPCNLVKDFFLTN